MRIAVIGATGRTGKHVVEQALERGNDVVALARSPSALTFTHPKLEVAHADVLKPETLGGSLVGVTGVVSALGVGSGRAKTDVYSQGVRNLLTAMSADGVCRLAVISAAPAGPRAEQPLAQRVIAMPLLELFFGATYEDMRRMETILGASDVNWVALRPPRLIHKPAKGSYRLSPEPVRGGRSITDLSVNLAAELREDRVNIGILTIVEPDDCRGLEVRPLAVERLVAVLPAYHPLATTQQLAVNQLRDEDFVVSPPGATIRTAVLRAAADAGFEPRIVFESREVTRIRAFAAAGLGIAILPRSDAASPGPQVAYVELVGEQFDHTLSLCWRDRRRHSPAARALLEHARDALDS